MPTLLFRKAEIVKIADFKGIALQKSKVNDKKSLYKNVPKNAAYYI
nr:MAG TPA: hypothetical protein [Caudoviricetes sp.]